MTTFNQVKANANSVGEWEGREQLAADNVNRIYKAIFDTVDADADADYDQDRLDQIIHDVWDDWGSEESLLTITDNEIAGYVAKVI
jgi:hypothetical protein